MKYIWIILLLYSCHLFANNGTQHDKQTWGNITVSGKFDQKQQWLYWLEGQLRFGNDSDRLTQNMVRPGLGYALSEKLSLWAGYARIQTGYPLTRHPFIENRIWQQLLWVNNTDHYTVISRTRLEQRFLQNASKTAWRTRQLFKLALPLMNHSRLGIVGSEEVFWHKNNFIGRNGSGFDQNRLFAGLGYQLTAGMVMEAGYMNQYIRRFGVPNFVANIFAVNWLVDMDA